MCNYKIYPEILPKHFSSIRVRSVRGNVSIVEEHINLAGKKFVIMAKHVMNPHALHEMFVIGGDLKGTVVRQNFSIVKDTTVVTTDVNVKLNLLMKIKSIFDYNQFEREYRTIMDDFATTVNNS